MKKVLLSTYFIITISILFGQDKTFLFQGFTIGSSLSGQSYYPRAMMPEIVKIGSEYLMYFGYESPTKSYILYATSIDMISWAIGDTILISSSDTTNREFIMGGPRVIKLPSGQYRLFYRATQKYTSTPFYHTRSAISNDGKNFTKEGICIEINNYDSNSQFTTVGHSEFYYDSGNNLRALLSAKDTTMTSIQPGNIFMAESSDGGLTWTNFVSLFNSSHDPVVIKDSLLNYHAYFSYLDTQFKTVTSSNGANWPSMTDELVMIQAGDTIIESSSPIKIADLGAAVDSTGHIVLFSNHATTTGPWTHIAYWTESISTGTLTQNTLSSVQVFPNPFLTSTTIELPSKPHTLSIYDIVGNKVREEQVSGTTIIERGDLSKGIYVLEVRSKKQTYSGRLVVE